MIENLLCNYHVLGSPSLVPEMNLTRVPWHKEI